MDQKGIFFWLAKSAGKGQLLQIFETADGQKGVVIFSSEKKADDYATAKLLSFEWEIVKAVTLDAARRFLERCIADGILMFTLDPDADRGHRAGPIAKLLEDKIFQPPNNPAPCV